MLKFLPSVSMRMITGIAYNVLIGLFLLFLDNVDCHGRMIDPPARNTLWRSVKTKNIPVNYNDNELNCGGLSYQWDSHGGKCGVCGDPYSGIPQNVYPGKYATGYIGRHYKKGQSILVKIEITSNQRGWFEFRVGDIISPPITQGKLKYSLVIEGPSLESNRFILPPQNGIFRIKVRLPSDLVCSQCVFQWWYQAGNSWGCDFDAVTKRKNCGFGLGKQETFVNCADISITSDGIPVVTTQFPPTVVPKERTFPELIKKTYIASLPIWKNIIWHTQKPVKSQASVKKKICKAKADGLWKNNPVIDNYCNANCYLFCPKPVCKCQYF